MSLGAYLRADLRAEERWGGRWFVVIQIFGVIRTLYRQDVTILLVAQNARRSLALADRGYVMETGTIRTSGPARDLLNDPRVKEAYLGG